MKKNPLLIILFCLALLVVLFFLLFKKPAIPEIKLAETPETGDLAEETFAGLRLNMTMAEVEAVLGKSANTTNDENICWFYEALTVTFHSFNEQVSEIRALTGSTFTLGSGIGIGSTGEEVSEAYPLAYETDGDLDIDKVDSWIYVDDPDCGLQIGVTDGIVSVIIWKDYGDPLLEALTVSEIMLYTTGGEPVLAIDKAAKRICTTMTISEPEAAPVPEGQPLGWMDFGDGTAVCLYEGDYAVVFRYEGTFEPTLTASNHLDGIFFGLGDAFAQALENPSETW